MGDLVKLPIKQQYIDYESEMERKLRGSEFVPISKGAKTTIGYVADYTKFNTLLQEVLKRT